MERVRKHTNRHTSRVQWTDYNTTSDGQELLPWPQVQNGHSLVGSDQSSAVDSAPVWPELPRPIMFGSELRMVGGGATAECDAEGVGGLEVTLAFAVWFCATAERDNAEQTTCQHLSAEQGTSNLSEGGESNAISTDALVLTIVDLAIKYVGTGSCAALYCKSASDAVTVYCVTNEERLISGSKHHHQCTESLCTMRAPECDLSYLAPHNFRPAHTDLSSFNRNDLISAGIQRLSCVASLRGRECRRTHFSGGSATAGSVGILSPAGHLLGASMRFHWRCVGSLIVAVSVRSAKLQRLFVSSLCIICANLSY